LFETDDSIVAIATPPGRGGIGVVRISGPKAQDIGLAILNRDRPLAPRLATFARAGISDEVIATYFPQPHSYTGQDVLEISAHGNPVVLQGIVRRAIDVGARLAEPGEFTLRAFLNGKRDLVRAEAVADLVDAATPLQARVAFDQLQGTLTERITGIDATLFDLIARLEASLDFPDEGYHFIEPIEIAGAIGAVMCEIDRLLADAVRGRMIREGATVVIAGRPNTGKSSIFNTLIGSERAIVTEIPGTTRDLVTERVDIGGLAVTLVDTAGWRDTLDVVEREGVVRGERARAVADLTLVVLDASAALTAEDEQLLEATVAKRRIVLGNKSDLRSAYACGDLQISAKTGAGIERLREAIACALTGDARPEPSRGARAERGGAESLRDTASVSNVRHIALLEQARASLAAARGAAASGATPEEFVLADLQAARARLDQIVGRRTSEDVLRHIFERFCIGK
jgi:tRNA modification GTPase